jgi:hypothetical protein
MNQEEQLQNNPLVQVLKKKEDHEHNSDIIIKRKECKMEKKTTECPYFLRES